MISYRVDTLSNEHQSYARLYESILFEHIVVQNEPLIYQVPINKLWEFRRAPKENKYQSLPEDVQYKL